MSAALKTAGYVCSKPRFLLSIIIVILSTALALVLLGTDPFLMFCYMLSTFSITVATFFLKTRFYIMAQKEPEYKRKEGEVARHLWRALLITFAMLMLLLIFPLVLARFLSSQAWFILITGLASGTSLSEIALYLSICLKKKSRNLGNQIS